MPTIQTPFGTLDVLSGPEFFPDGSPRSCIVAGAYHFATPLGPLVPQFTANTLRKRQLPAISFHPNGMIRNLPLEEQTQVATPLGSMPAEQVTFYDTGALKRVFPLNGTLSGYWTQEDEAALAKPMTLDTPFGPVEALIVSVYFNPQGALRSLTLWPGQTIGVPSPVGAVTTRIGVSFFDSGAIKSLEPATLSAVPTPVGELLAFDPDAVGICGDENSLRFRENGALLGLKTHAHSFDVTLENGRVCRVNPSLRRHPCDSERMEAASLSLEFGSGRVSLTGEGVLRMIAPVEEVHASRFCLPMQVLSPGCTMGAGKW
jgi:hypothetical protein